MVSFFRRGWVACVLGVLLAVAPGAAEAQWANRYWVGSGNWAEWSSGIPENDIWRSESPEGTLTRWSSFPDDKRAFLGTLGDGPLPVYSTISLNWVVATSGTTTLVPYGSGPLAQLALKQWAGARSGVAAYPDAKLVVDVPFFMQFSSGVIDLFGGGEMEFRKPSQFIFSTAVARGLNVFDDGTHVIFTAADAIDNGTASNPITMGAGTTLQLDGRNAYRQPLTLGNATVLANAVDALVFEGSGTAVFVNGVAAGVTGGSVIAPGPAGGSLQMAATKTVTVNPTNDASGVDLDVRADINGFGGIVKNGAGLLALSGANSFEGGVQVNAGTLLLTAPSAQPAFGTVAVADGATLALRVGPSAFPSSAFQALLTDTLPGVILGPAALAGIDTSDADATVADALSGSRGLAKLGRNTLTLTGQNTYAGATSILGGTLRVGAGGVTGSLGTGDVVNNGELVFDRANALVVGNRVDGSGSLVQAGAGTLTLTGSNTFSGDTRAAGGTLAVGHAHALAGSTLDLRADDAGTVTFLQGSRLGGLAGVRSLSNGGHTLTVGGNGQSTTYAGNLSGSGGLVKIGGGSLSLAGVNGFTGGTRVSAGEVRFASAGAVPASGEILVEAGGLVAAEGSVVGGLLSAGRIDPASSGAVALTSDYAGSLDFSSFDSLRLGASGAATISGPITPPTSGFQLGGGGGSLTVASPLTGAAGLVVNGPGRVVLAADNAYAGGTTIASGTLQVGAGGAVGSLGSPANVVNNGRLEFARGDALAFSGTITGSGGVTQLGGGTLTLSASNAYTGSTRVAAGGLVVAHPFALGGSTLDLDASDTGTVTFNQNSTLGGLSGSRDLDMGGRLLSIGANGQVASYAGTLSNGSLNKVGEGMLVLTGSSGYAGGTVVTAGALVAGSPQSIPQTGAFSVGSGAVMGLRIGEGGFTVDEFKALQSGTFPGISMAPGALAGIDTTPGSLQVGALLDGSHGLVKLGTNNLTLSARNTFTGGTIVQSGALGITTSDGVLNGDVVIKPGARLDVLTRTALGTQPSNSVKSITIDHGTLDGGGAFAMTTAETVTMIGGLITGNRFEWAFDNTPTPVLRTLPSNVNAIVASPIWLRLLDDSVGQLTFDVASGNAPADIDLFIGGQITPATEAGGGGGIRKIGPGRLVLGNVNDYTGPTRIDEGILQIGNGDGYSTLSPRSSEIINNATLAFNRNNSYSVSNLIEGTGSVVQRGTGVLTLDSFNTYTGDTVVERGTLRLGFSGFITESQRVFVADGATFDVLDSFPDYPVPATQTLSGAGTVAGSVSIGGGATLEPGASPGTLTVTQNVSFAAGGHYNWEITSATGGAGLITGWDLVDIGGVLDVTAFSAAPFNINLWSLSDPTTSGPAANFSASQNYSWRIASAAGGIFGFSPDAFRVNVSATNGTGGFVNAIGDGTFSVAQAGNDLNLVYTAGSAPVDIVIDVPSGQTQTQGQAGYPLLSGATPVQKTGAGTLVLDAANTLSGNLAVNAGTAVAADTQALGTATLDVAAGATLAISPVVGAANAVQVADLGTIAGRIDVGTGRFALPASGESPGAELRSLLVAGRSGGTWNGASGIMSSDAPNYDGKSGFAVGYRVAANNSATVAWASLGDADLDGAVTTADVNAILTSGLLNTGIPGAVWQQGDFDYDGLVTTADINALLTTGRLNSGSYLPVAPAASPTAVPEPSTLLLLGIGGTTAFLGCRRRRNR